ncbi:sulfotransferase family 2 domain-containing protein [Parahaliea mediterranea]|uniref:Sulfotransferase family 2 domain-containing protein n=1 Tax=Parahaliea mediterranea TaxID=651086 RepID=A0A939IK79_9GAMM|nr:sulfotransferase family 2 domain-containing protein [Parahaliea mediterranea]MBN7795180.1 sulfotransferase family 2 domain-containing protein [Parahaliea mediterranea]
MPRKQYPEKCTDEDFVFFLHIPKTAGTAVSKSLSPLFPEDRVLTHYQMNNVRKHPRDIYLGARFLHGHFTHDVYGKRLPKQPSFILTFLRDPVAHYISTFFHLKIDPTFTYTTRLCQQPELAREIHQFVENRPIEDFFDYEHAHIFDNFQTRYLVKGLSSDYPGMSDEALLPIAERLLIDLPFFGITEQIDSSMRLLQSVVSTRKQLQIGQVNRSRNKPRDYALSDNALAEIRRRTGVDHRLYRFAVAAFEDRLWQLPGEDRS